MATSTNNPVEQQDTSGEQTVTGGGSCEAFNAQITETPWKDLQADYASLRQSTAQCAQAGDLRTASLPGLDLVQHPEETITANQGDTPESIAKSMSGNLRPAPTEAGLRRMAEGIALANGMGHSPYTEFGQGKEVKVPEIDKDGKMTVSDGEKKYEIWTNGAYREHAVGDDSTGRGWDSLGNDGGREYTFQKNPDGTERRNYAAGGHEIFNGDGLSGTGVTSKAEDSRPYTFKINPDGSQTRTYSDNGDQQKINADGSSVFKHIDPNDPTKSFLRTVDSSGKIGNEFDIPPESSLKSLEDITRDMAVKNWGDGKGNFLANTSLLQQAVSDAYSRGGDKAVQALAKEIQSRMVAGNPNADSATFSLRQIEPGNYDVVRSVNTGSHTDKYESGVRFTPKKFH